MKRSTKKAIVFLTAILIVLIIIIIILAVTNKPVKEESQMGQTIIAEKATEAVEGVTTAAEEETETAAAEETVVDLPNEKEVRLYMGSGGEMDVVTEYSCTWSVDEDIASFEAINSTEDVIYYDDYYTLHSDYWYAVDTDVTYKIGYELSFDVGDEHKVYTILKPADISDNPDLFMGDAANDTVTGYMGVWVYCDIGQTGTYIHLTQADMQEDTLMTSIKLRPTPQSSEISNFKLKAFSYTSDAEFDSDGHYIGTHGYEISIYNQ